MKTVARAVTFLALVALATPALPCPSMMKTTQGDEAAPPVAKTEAKEAVSKEKVTKAEKGARGRAQKEGQPAKAAPVAVN